jgi:epoxyqueuosine reductase
MTPTDWETLDRDTYQRLFKGSAVKRAKFEGLKRNIQQMTQEKNI